ncbi:hypothetical protein CASFOL_027807 [Castilleja foliolosa]|uniref:F-box domain-containing protein n=1 Tax=Castilleja foliolosa TaxID=1961234 RepID=A0ABD3CFW9_9LAMI
MSPEKSKNDQATNSAAAALADCEDLMLCILARLPLKSIIRFKFVCKSWNHLLSTQEFVKMHYKLSTESKNQSFLVHRLDKDGRNTISVFNIDSNRKKARNLYNPLNFTCVEINIVGCCNGLVCIKSGQRLVLWNPAMSLSKTVLLLTQYRYSRSESLGFGYHAESYAFKVVRIILKKERRLMCVSCVEVYSLNSDSWTTIDLGFQFSELWFNWIKNSATVNGNPYWVGKDAEMNDVLVCFDMAKLVFKIVPLSSLDYNKAKQDIEFVDLNGSLGALVVTFESQKGFYSNLWENEKNIEYVDFWVFDEGEQIWTKSHSVGPIEVKMTRVFRCLNDGKILSKRPKGQLIVFNSETKCVKDFFNVEHDLKIYDYTASLAYIEGMEKVTRHAWRTLKE